MNHGIGAALHEIDQDHGTPIVKSAALREETVSLALNYTFTQKLYISIIVELFSLFIGDSMVIGCE